MPTEDVERVFDKFDKDIYLGEEKVKLARDLLRKVYSGFTSQKLLSLKNKNEEWILKKHLSTRERFPYYGELYKKLIWDFDETLTVIDLGCGINGFSYKFFKKKINYFGVEAIGQLVDLTDYYFKKEKINGKAVHLSLFELDKLKNLIKNIKKPKIIFLFKTLDSLEMIERNYSKKLLKEITPLVNFVIVSFATESMKKRERFRVNRNWILEFIKSNFDFKEDFNFGGERYIIFSKK